MSFKFDAFGNKLNQKITRRDHSVLSNDYQKHEGADHLELGKQGRGSNINWDETPSDDIHHSFRNDHGDHSHSASWISGTSTQFVFRIIIVL